MPHDFVSFFVCNIGKPIVWSISAKEIVTILRKITIHLRQVSLKSILLSVRVLEYFGKNPLKAPLKRLNL